MRVNEIFKSIQGEGVHSQVPMTFLRLYGCNIRCKWCDTLYAVEGDSYSELSVAEVANRLEVLGSKWVAITGGEPLIHSELVTLLERIKAFTEVWTNGVLKPPSWVHLVSSWVIDVKCPSSGCTSNHQLWLPWLRPQDQLKFTVASEEDLEFVDRFLDFKRSTLLAGILVSPVAAQEPLWTRFWLQRVWRYCVEKNLRFSLQIQKVVWGSRKGA